MGKTDEELLKDEHLNHPQPEVAFEFTRAYAIADPTESTMSVKRIEQL